MSRIGGTLGLLLGLSVAAAGDKRGDKPATPEDRYKALVKEYYEATNAFWKAQTEEERKQAVARVDRLPLQVLEMAEKNPKSPLALDALVQAVAQEMWLEENAAYLIGGRDSPGVRAIALLLRDHVTSAKLGEACRRMSYGFRKEFET